MLGFAVSAFALPAEIPADTTAAIAKGGTQVTIGGELRVRGSTRQNMSDYNKYVSNGVITPSNGNSIGKSEHMLYDSRYRLSVEAKVTPNTIGFIQLEAADTTNTGENSTWGASGTTQRTYGGSFRYGDQKQNEMRVLQAWIQHSGSGLLGIPAYIKIGHQMIQVGAGVFYSHTLQGDDAIVLGISPIKGLDLTALTVKLQENKNLSADDQDLYSFIASYQINKDIAIGIDVSYLDSQTGSVWSTGWSHLWNIGFNAKANIQGFKLYGTADFQTGRDNVRPFWNYRGYAFTAGAAYTFAPVTIALDLGYGSGDGNSTDLKNTTFFTSQSDVVHYTFVYDYMTVNAAGNQAGGLQNTLFAKLGANADVVKNLNLAGSITLLSAAKKAYGAGDPLSVGGSATSSKYIGTEIDSTLTYQIDKGLKYFVEAGYLFAGNYWKVPVMGTAAAKISDPWAVRHGIQLNF
jgi:hypothetical protein